MTPGAPLLPDTAAILAWGLDPSTLELEGDHAALSARLFGPGRQLTSWTMGYPAVDTLRNRMLIELDVRARQEDPDFMDHHFTYADTAVTSGPSQLTLSVNGNSYTGTVYTAPEGAHMRERWAVGLDLPAGTGVLLVGIGFPLPEVIALTAVAAE